MHINTVRPENGVLINLDSVGKQLIIEMDGGVCFGQAEMLLRNIDFVLLTSKIWFGFY
jgi:hypothetical protein